MRYLIAPLALAMLTTTAVSARADHRLSDTAESYHDSVHVLADYIAHDRHSSHYLARYTSRLDDVSHDFAEALIHDPYASRTRGLFEDVRSLHYRVQNLLGHGCHSLPGAAAAWHDADQYFYRMSLAFTDACDHHSHHGHRVIQKRVILPARPEMTYPRQRVEIYGESLSRRPQENRDPRYNLDRQRQERQSINSRNLNQRPSTSQRSLQVDASSAAVSRLLSSLFN